MINEISPVDYDRIRKYLHQPKEGMSNSNLVVLWNIATNYYLPRKEDKQSPLVNME
jgi:hypothetical protein